MPTRTPLLLLAVLTLAACSSESAPSPAAPPPPPPGPGAAPPPAAPSPPGVAAPNPIAAMKSLADVAKQMGEGQPTGPVVNWRDLAPFLPETLAGFTAKGEVDGSTTNMQGMQVTTVSRRYERGDERMKVEILDTSWAPFLRTPFAFVQMIQEDSSKGYKKGITFKGQPAIAEWRNSGQSELHALLGQRFLINLEIKTKTMGLAEQVGEAMDVNGIMASAAKAQAQAATPGAPVPPPAPGK